MKPPVETIFAAMGSMWGRSLSYFAAMVVPIVLLHGPVNGLASLPLFIVGSLITGWVVILIYSSLLILFLCYVRFELSMWVLLVPLLICAADFYRVAHAFSQS